MTTEDKLKELILTRYQSIREFTIVTEIAYSTFDTIMRRGINHANIANVFKICSVLHISADALANGEIVPTTDEKKDSEESATNDVMKILENTRHQLLNNNGLMFDGEPASRETINAILNTIDIGIELAKRNKK